jgi:hypothetical protein
MPLIIKFGKSFRNARYVESFAASNAAINDSVRCMSRFGLESYQRAATHW